MDASSAPLDPERAKQQFSRQLDHLLAPLVRACRFPVPMPDKFQETETSPGGASASNSPRVNTQQASFTSVANGQSSRKPTSRDEQAAAAERDKWANAAAYRLCVQQVPGLSRLEERLRQGRATGTECEEALQQLLTSLGSMLEVTKSVQSQSEHLNQSASTLLLRKNRLERVRDELERTIQHFTHIEDLVREAEDPMLTATSSRFMSLAEDINAEMIFLTRHSHFKSAPVYAVNVARAQQRLTWTLRTALRSALQEASRTTVQSEAYRSALNPRAARRGTSADGMESSGIFLEVADEAHLFASALDAVNVEFLQALDSTTTLRRISELLIGTTQQAAVEAFGNTLMPRGALTREAFLTDILNAYRDARVSVVCPLLRAWVVASCTAGTSSSASAHPPAAIMPPTPAASVPTSPPSDGPVPASLGDSLSSPPGLPGSPQASLAARSASVSVTGALMGENVTLPYLAGHLCALMDACLEGERDVQERVWLREEVASAVLPKLVGEVTEEVYHAFRSRLLRVDGISELAETIQSIQSVPYRTEQNRPQSHEIGELWQRMIQDTQERMIFRTSVFIRQDIGRAWVTAETASQYVRLATPVQATVGADSSSMIVPHDEEHNVPFIPAIKNTVKLVKCLYPTLEFSVFSTFAEEAIHLSLGSLQDLARLVNEQERKVTQRTQPFLGYACQVAHLLYLRVELSRIDAKIVVVEKKLDFAALRRTRLSVIQSSRESKKDVDSELVTASDRLIQCMLTTVSLPLEGAARKSAQDAEEAVQRAEVALALCEYGVRALVAPMPDGTLPAEELLAPVRRRLDELLGTITSTHVQALAATANPDVSSAPRAEPVAGSLEEAARTATDLAAGGAPPLAPVQPDMAQPTVDSDEL